MPNFEWVVSPEAPEQRTNFEWVDEQGQPLAQPPNFPSITQPLETTGRALEATFIAPGEYLRGAVVGRPGTRLTPSEMTDIAFEPPGGWQEPALPATLATAASFVDPWTLPLAGVAPAVRGLKGLFAEPTRPPSTYALFQNIQQRERPPFQVPRIEGQPISPEHRLLVTSAPEAPLTYKAGGPRVPVDIEEQVQARQGPRPRLFFRTDLLEQEARKAGFPNIRLARLAVEAFERAPNSETAYLVKDMPEWVRQGVRAYQPEGLTPGPALPLGARVMQQKEVVSQERAIVRAVHQGLLSIEEARTRMAALKQHNEFWNPDFPALAEGPLPTQQELVEREMHFGQRQVAAPLTPLAPGTTQTPAASMLGRPPAPPGVPPTPFPTTQIGVRRLTGQPQDPYLIIPQERKALIKGYAEAAQKTGIITPQEHAEFLTGSRINQGPLTPVTAAWVDDPVFATPQGPAIFTLVRRYTREGRTAADATEAAAQARTQFQHLPAMAGPRTLEEVPELHLPGSAGQPIEMKPNLHTRLFGDSLLALSKTGPVGERMSSLLHHAYDNAEQGTSLLFKDHVDAILNRVAGRKAFPSLHRSPFKDWSVEDLYHISTDEKRALVNYMYTGGEPKWLAQLSKDSQDKVKEIAWGLFREVEGPVSEQAHLAGLKMIDHKGQVVEMGQPSMYFPNLPVTAGRRAKLDDITVKRLLRAAQAKNPGRWGDAGEPLTETQLIEYKEALSSYHRLAPSVRANKFRTFELTREFDASMGGTESAYDNLLRMGYETDPLRAMFRVSSKGLLRTELAKIEPEITRGLAQLRLDFGEAPLQGLERLTALSDPTDRASWATKVVNYAMGQTREEEYDRFLQKFVRGLRSFNDATLLQMASLMNYNQISYGIARGGVANTIRAILATRGGMVDPRSLAERSGPLYTALLQELSEPTAGWSKAAMGSLRMSGFSGTDRWVRYFNAHIGDAYLKDITHQLLKSPANQVVRRQFLELNVNPDDVLKAGGLTDELEMRGVQTFANYTSGRTGPRGLPAFAQNDHELAQLLLQYRKFLLTNTAEVARGVVNAPSASHAMQRATRLGGAAILFGETTRDIQDLLINQSNPFESVGGRTAKPIKHLLGPGLAGRLADDLVSGLATVYGALVLTTVMGRRDSTLSQLAGVTAGGIADVLSAAHHVATGQPERALEVAGRRIPVAPLVGPLVGSALRQKRERLERLGSIESAVRAFEQEP